MTGIYPKAYWYNRLDSVIIRLVERRSFAGTMLRVLLASASGASLSSGQAPGEPEHRATPARQIIVGIDYNYAWFQGDIDPWNMGVISIGQRRASGSFIARMNLARRFATNGTQFEADAYPTLGKKGYAYLNSGYSGSGVFPQWRFGGELFRALPRAFEASAGFRQLRFEGSDPVTLLTGSVGRYSGNYWYSLRPYFREKDNGLSSSATLTARRYYADADNWVGGRIGYGSSPSDDLLLSQLARTGTMSAAVNASRSTSPRAVTLWTFSFEREELLGSRVRNHWEAGAGLRLRY
jgi:YaiO family outer membrane protein